MRTNGSVHYFINGNSRDIGSDKIRFRCLQSLEPISDNDGIFAGTDLGPSTSGISQPVWGAINLYGMAAKVGLAKAMKLLKKKSLILLS
jgi:hypothetical protein